MLRLPASTFSPECAAIRFLERQEHRHGESDRSPVLLVHGYAGSHRMWTPLRLALAKAGFGELIYLHYNALRADIHQIADWVVDLAHTSMRSTGASAASI